MPIYIANFVKRTDFDNKLKDLNQTKHVLVENELKKLQDKIEKIQTYSSSLFIGESYFLNYGAQLYLILQTLSYTLKRVGNTEKIVSWKYKGFSGRKTYTPTTDDKSLSPSIKWYANSSFCLVFKGSYLKQKNVTYTPPNRMNIFTVYELDTWSRYLNSDFTLKDCLFGGVKVAKNADPDKNVYSGYGIGLVCVQNFS